MLGIEEEGFFIFVCSFRLCAMWLTVDAATAPAAVAAPLSPCPALPVQSDCTDFVRKCRLCRTKFELCADA